VEGKGTLGLENEGFVGLDAPVRMRGALVAALEGAAKVGGAATVAFVMGFARLLAEMAVH